MSIDHASTVQGLLERHLGAKLVEDEYATLRDGPGPQRLSTAFDEVRATGGHFTSERPGDVRTSGVVGISEHSAQVLRFWRPWISAWYWNSPTAILECPECGELRLTGSKPSPRPKCKRGCGVRVVTIEPPFAGRRPRPKKVEL